MSTLEQAARDLEKATARLMHVGCEAGVASSKTWGGEWRDLVARVRDQQHALRAALDAGQTQPVAPAEPTPEQVALLDPWMRPEAARELLRKVLAASPASPPARQPLTDEQITAAARVLNNRHADACGVNEADSWALYYDEFKADARAALNAAHGIGAKA